MRTHGWMTRRLAAWCVATMATAAALPLGPVAAQQPLPAEDTAAGPQYPLPAGPRTGEELTVYHAVFDQGDAVWEKFGHNAIWIHDATSGSTISYNYGMFSFDQAGFIPRLMRGDMLYWMDARNADDELAAYTYFDRTVTVQRLNLLPAQRHALREYLEWNWLPENREYLYDYFRDNCSTRVRDALDRALGGAISGALTGVPSGTSFRWHSLRLTAASTATSAGLLLGLGPPTDEPIDAWEEGFIPMLLMDHLRTVQVPDGRGGMQPLVAEERVLYQSSREPAAAAPPSRIAGFLLVGVLAGAAFAALGYFAGRRRQAGRRAAFGLAVAFTAWGVITGFFGLILALLWAATNHVYSYGNLNLLQVNPLGFLLAVAAPLAVLHRTTGRFHATSRLAWPAAVTPAALSIVGLLLHAVPGVDQVNGPIIALALPIHLGAVLALYQAIRGPASSNEDASAEMRLPAAA
ncbi:MAG TPA: DUF4105 domain-containing protein [Longimicrobiales bacterium]|nr:DUF4105 domain-containing protein [Longimicrobiales bacterium]